MAASDYVPIFFKNRLHLAGRPQMGSRPILERWSSCQVQRGLNAAFQDLLCLGSVGHGPRELEGAHHETEDGRRARPLAAESASGSSAARVDT
jgi:hypothetical protein